MGRRIKNHPEFSFEQPPAEIDPSEDKKSKKTTEPSSIIDSPEFKNAKDKVNTNYVLGREEDRVQKTVYSLLSEEERREHDALGTKSEKRAYIVKKYSKILGELPD